MIYTFIIINLQQHISAQCMLDGSDRNHQQTGVLLEVRLGNQCLGEEEWRIVFFVFSH